MLYVIGVMSVAKVKVMDGLGLSTSGGMPSARHGGGGSVQRVYAPNWEIGRTIIVGLIEDRVVGVRRRHASISLVGGRTNGL